MRRIRVQSYQANERDALLHADDVFLDRMVRTLESVAIVDPQGRPIGVMGFEPHHEQCVRAWALICEHCPRSGLLAFVRTARNHLAALRPRFRRIEMVADSHFSQANRLALMLGFEHEGTMRAYGPDGRDFDLYAMVQ